MSFVVLYKHRVVSTHDSESEAKVTLGFWIQWFSNLEIVRIEKTWKRQAGDKDA